LIAKVLEARKKGALGEAEHGGLWEMKGRGPADRSIDEGDVRADDER
jgi:hypothetical protein